MNKIRRNSSGLTLAITEQLGDGNCAFERHKRNGFRTGVVGERDA